MKHHAEVQIIGVGDIAFQQPVSSALEQRVRRWRDAFEADGPGILVGNLEIPLTVRGTPADKPVVFRGNPSGAQCLKRMGFDILSLANNHALDYGVEGLNDTLEALKANDLEHIGVGVGMDALAPAIRTFGNTQIAFLSFCSTVPRGYAAAIDRLGVAPLRAHQTVYLDGALFDEQPGTAPYVQSWPHEEDATRAEQLVRTLKRQGVDIVVASVHWGVPPMWLAPYQGVLAGYQRPLALRLVRAGVDIILGHHPHVPQFWELLAGRPVFYSLGNFIFSPYKEEHRQDGPVTPELTAVTLPAETQEGLLVRVNVGGGKLTKIGIYTFVLDENGEPFVPPPERHEAITKRLRAQSVEEDRLPLNWAPLTDEDSDYRNC